MKVTCFGCDTVIEAHDVSAIADAFVAHARGAAWIEAYPINVPEDTDGGHFRGPRGIYEARGFQPVVVGERDTVLRRRVG